MIPRKLMLRNFMCYREDVPALEFDGMTIACLSGENGAGKSALLDALTWALWGEARLRSDDDLIALGAQEMEVDLTFMLDGQDYRVIRKRNKGKRGQSWLDFQVRDNGSWRAISGATLRETQQAIVKTLHMGYDTFTNSAFLRQGRADDFTRKEPSKRKQVLAEILGLDVYEDLEGAAKERAKTLDGQIKNLEGKIAELERQAENREYHALAVTEAQARVAALEDEVTAAEQALEAANERVQVLERVKGQRDDLERRLDALRRDRAELAQVVEERGRKLDAARAFLTRRDEILSNLAALHAAHAEVERLDGLRETYTLLLEQRRTHLDAINAERMQREADKRVTEGQLKSIHDRAARRPRLETQIAQIREQLGGATSATDELNSARNRRDELQDRVRSVNRLRLERADLQKQIDLKHDSLVGSREELKRRLKDANNRLRDADRWRIELGQAGTERMRLEQDERRMELLRQNERELVEQAGALRAACSNAELQGKEINKKLALLTADLHACPLCGSELGADGVAHIETEYENQRRTLRAQYSNDKREAERVESQLNGLRSEMQALEQRLATLPDLAARIARLESDLQNAEETRRGQAEDQRALSEIELQLVKGSYEPAARADLARVEAGIAGLGDPDALEREMDRLDARIRKLETQIAEQTSLRSKLDGLLRDVDTIESEMPALHELEEDLHKLETLLQTEDYAHEARAALATLDGEIAAMGYSNERHAAARAEVKALAAWADEERKLERAEERIANDAPAQERDEALLRRRDEELTAMTEQAQQLQRQLSELAPAVRHRDEAAGALQVHRRTLSVTQRDLGEKEANLKKAEDAAADLIGCNEQRRTLLHRKGLFDELTTSFGKKGVQALLIETAIPEIEREANRLLGAMTDNQMHLTFETQRDTKKGDVTETLDIRIADALGTRDYDAYSGGESFRVDFAIRIALARLLARRAGARLETLVIDEGFGSQDARGRERLVEAITSVQRDFKQILVVTHIQELKDLFPIHIEITKTEQGSKWAIG